MKSLFEVSGKTIIILVLLICSATVYANRCRAAKNDLSDEEKIYGLSLLWKEADYNFAHFDSVPDLDWDKTYQKYIPQARGKFQR